MKLRKIEAKKSLMMEKKIGIIAPLKVCQINLFKEMQKLIINSLSIKRLKISTLIKKSNNNQ
jgi:hypothetical protein